MSSAGSDACRLLLSLSLSIDSEGVALVFLESEQNTVASYWRILLSQDCFTALCIGLYHFANSFSTSEPRFPTVFDRKCKKRAAAGGIAFLHSLLWPSLPFVTPFRRECPQRPVRVPTLHSIRRLCCSRSARHSFCNRRRRRSGLAAFLQDLDASHYPTHPRYEGFGACSRIGLSHRLCCPSGL